VLGHKANQNKILKSIIIGFGLYFATQCVTLLCIYVFGLFNPTVMNLLNTTDIVNIDVIKSVMYAGIGLYIIYLFFYYILGKVQFEKGVNVD